MTKTMHKKKKHNKAKWLSWESCEYLRKEVKGKGENKRYIYPNAEFQRIAR